ncbi:hypothetical protein GCM10010123_45510 [Pilimelia anulata]|uniref:Uncharacterized protein n=1 Tax=Pilimelia anulata TaxID=53371 RepID=A0A8J3BFH8_9ACTN|nr:hypothetical protein GCM10010123_45510 [Pilimelia anulata]
MAEQQQPDSGDTIPGELTAPIANNGGGVMTDEVGAVTGELTLGTRVDKGRLVLRVQYRDADEWYAVTGPALDVPDPAVLPLLHALAAGLLHRPEG